MNKRMFFLLPALFFLTTIKAQSVFNLKVRTIEGDSVSISQFAAKKTMFIVLPLNKQDAVYQQLQSFKARYKDSVNIVGIISMEDGFKTNQANAIKNLYAGMGIVLTEGMYTRKTSGANQSALLQWLTNKDKNHHFNNDAAGIGMKFFISEGGRLFAVLPPQASLQMPMIDKIVHSGSGNKQ